MTTEQQAAALSFVKRCAAAAAKFTEDMRAADIHVGLGARDPRCVSCDERWPCPTAEARRKAAERPDGREGPTGAAEPQSGS